MILVTILVTLETLLVTILVTEMLLEMLLELLLATILVTLLEMPTGSLRLRLGSPARLSVLAVMAILAPPLLAGSPRSFQKPGTRGRHLNQNILLVGSSSRILYR